MEKITKAEPIKRLRISIISILLHQNYSIEASERIAQDIVEYLNNKNCNGIKLTGKKPPKHLRGNHVYRRRP